MINLRLSILIILLSSSLTAQQTVGLFQNDTDSYQGYTLFSPVLGTDVYLIDNCGEYVNKWDLESRPGLMAYMMSDGSLLRTERVGSNFNAGGNAGRLRKYDWEGNMTWTFDISDDDFHSHHDVAVLPNGNILAIVWEAFAADDVISMGRDPMLVEGALWMEKIVELKPIGEEEAEEVWSWHLSDHLVQDYDSTKINFGVVSEHPEKMNLNYNGGGSFPLGNNKDWVHINGIDYNEELDQIILSSRHFSEVWIIDHSTTTEEAASNEGGNSGKGGDLLYRWGNPRVYDRGTTSDQRLYLQHDATWIKMGDNQKWGFSVYNNGTGRPGPDFSQVDLIQLPILANNNYEILDSFPYAPALPNLTINEIEGETFFNTNISGSSLLPNGNALICVGGIGEFSEIDTSTLERVWHYVVPLSADEPVIQGETTSANSIFKVRRYGPDFAGFENRDLTPNGLIENDPLPSSCVTPTSIVNRKLDPLTLWPNPASESIKVEGSFIDNIELEIYNVWGQLIRHQKVFPGQLIDVSKLPAGIYIIHIANHKATKLVIQ